MCLLKRAVKRILKFATKSEKKNPSKSEAAVLLKAKWIYTFSESHVYIYKKKM